MSRRSSALADRRRAPPHPPLEGAGGVRRGDRSQVESILRSQDEPSLGAEPLGLERLERFAADVYERLTLSVRWERGK